MKKLVQSPIQVFFNCLFWIISLLSVQSLAAELQLPRLISDGMVLQRDVELNIWGWAGPGTKVQINFFEKDYSAITDAGGKWVVTLPKMPAGGPFQMLISNAGEQLAVKDILIGDVWLCSGQSNMELNMERASPLYEAEIRQARHPQLRYFQVPKVYNFKQAQEDLSGGEWTAITSENIRSVSALCYFFGLDLQASQQVPIGIINASLGGSPAEAWISLDALQQYPALHSEALRFQNDATIDSIRRSDQLSSQHWYAEADRLDKGNLFAVERWSAASHEPENWEPIFLPGDWSATPIAGQAGVIWVRRTFDAPIAWAGQAAYLELGRIVDADSVFINGHFVGRTTYQYPPRRYTVPEGVLRAGENSIVVRVVSNNGRAEFVTDKAYQISCREEKIDLFGTWYYRQGVQLENTPSTTFIRWKPTGLYNGMLAPLFPYAIKGVVWYQGESNVSRAHEYEDLMTTLIDNWRTQWGRKELPFLIAQLPNFQRPALMPVESKWAELRDAQRRLSLLPGVDLAVTIDLGEWNDIHPLNKKAVAQRLALVARKSIYEEELVASGPLLLHHEQEGNRIRLHFSGVGSGLVAGKGGPLQHFAIAGADGQYVWAEARIEGATVVVWSPEVEEPRSVRYGWSDNPLLANLYNLEGLPASPFTTED